MWMLLLFLISSQLGEVQSMFWLQLILGNEKISP